MVSARTSVARDASRWSCLDLLAVATLVLANINNLDPDTKFDLFVEQALQLTLMLHLAVHHSGFSFYCLHRWHYKEFCQGAMIGTHMQRQ